MSTTAQDLKVFFDGLNAGLSSYRHIRSLYNEQVAFGFNYTSIFGPDENKTSDILAFLLDPRAPHGQKTTFLKLFLNLFGLKVPPTLLEDGKQIAVNTQSQTEKGRFIDITICFGKDEYVIGIENKIREWTPDQPDQLKDYAEELERITRHHNNWVLFYLTPNRHDPSGDSITLERRSELRKAGNELKIISYREDIKKLLEQCEFACKADNVRAFLKDFKQWINQDILGEAIMDEQKVIADYLGSNPIIAGYIRPLNAALDTLTQDCRGKLLAELEKDLGSEGIDLGEPIHGEGGPNSCDWVVTKSLAEIKFGETNIDIRIQANWSEDGFALTNGVVSRLPRFFELVKKELTSEKGYTTGQGWHGGAYDVSANDRLTDEKLIQLLKSAEERSRIVSGWVSRISNYVDTVARVCNQGTAATGSTPHS